jgi:hypothetical protein
MASAESRIDQVRQREVDETVVAAEWHCGLGAIGGERHEALALSAGENDAKDLLRCHDTTVEECLPCTSE